MIQRGVYFLLTIFCVLTALSARAQSEIYISDASRDISIVTIAPNACSLVDIVNTDRSLSDITLHPSGRMYGCNFSNRTIYEVDLMTGQTNAIVTISEANRLVGMTADASGLLYVTEGEVIPSSLYVVDPVAGTYVDKGLLADGSAGDLTWSFGKLYNASDNNKLVEVNVEDPASSVVIGNFVGVERAGDRIFGLVSVFTSCTETITYGLSELGDYYSLDLETAEVDRLCIGSISLYGSTSEDEFRASECFIGLDLDEDNSSGAVINDFNSEFDCPSGSAFIADDDVDLIVDTQVDSLVISLSEGILDGADEFLEPGTGTNLTVTGNGTTISAVSSGASVAEVIDFIQSLLYRNTAAPVTAGTRVVTCIAYSEGKSDTARAYIPITGSVDAGLDGMLTICAGMSAVDLTEYLGGSPDAGGTWSPATTAGSGIYNPDIDPGGTYTYTVTDGCFTDEAEVAVALVLEEPLDIGNDTSICGASSFIIDAQLPFPEGSYLWNTGEITPSIEVNSDGTYSVTVTYLDCTLTDEIEVSFGTVNVDIGDTGVICADGDLQLDAGIPSATAVYLWNTGAASPQITVNSAGSYWVTVTDNGCSGGDTVEVIEVPDLDIGLPDDTSVCSGASVLLDADVMLPGAGYLWNTGATGPAISVSSAGTYTVVVDLGACAFRDSTIVDSRDVLVDLGPDFSLCPGDAVTVSADIGSPDAVYIWNTGAGTPVINVTAGGTYSVVVTDGGCTGSDTVAVSESTGSPIEFSLGPDITICLSESATFTSGFSPLVYDHVWSTGSTNNTITTSSAGQYVLELSNACQYGVDTVNLAVEDCDTVIIDPPDTIDVTDPEVCEPVLPTAFTPDRNGYNDVFQPLEVCPDLLEYDFRVYNRYGELLHRGDEFSYWDGRFNGSDVPMDVYTWYLEARASDGSVVSWSGVVAVIR